jgi:hypothetical protein
VREEVDRVFRGKDYKYVEADWKNTWWEHLEERPKTVWIEDGKKL